MNSTAKKSILEKNIKTLRKFKVGTNVVVSDVYPLESTSSAQFGTITGFSLNCFGELCVQVALATQTDTPEIRAFHPENATFTITQV